MKQPHGEIGVLYERDAATLYQSAMRRLIGKAREERAEFPLEVAVTNVKGEGLERHRHAKGWHGRL